MGHQKLQDTTLYVHLSRRHLHAAVNPLERINVPGLPQTSSEPSETGIETARRNPSLRNIIRIAVALGVPVRELFQD